MWHEATNELALVTREIRDSIELLATLILGTNEEDKGSARSQAILTYCAFIGGSTSELIRQSLIGVAFTASL